MKKNSPFVTIIVPVYNSEDYIERCIESILNQTFKNYELILLDDGSKDKSSEILDKYSEEYKGKIIVEHQKNMGVAKTRNKAIKMAQGKYVMFIDNDDYIDKDYVETFYRAAEKDKSDLVIGGYRRPNEDGKILTEVELEDYKWSKYIVFAPWAKIYKKEYLLQNNIEFLSNNIGEDVYFNIQAINLSNKIKIIKYIGYNWFFNTASVSNTTQKSIKDLKLYNLLDSVYDVLKEKEILEKEYKYIEYMYIRYAFWVLTFSTKKLDYKTISKEYDKLFKWLEKHFPNYKKNKLIGFNKLKGETKIIKLSLSVFMFLHKIKLGKLLIYLYSKI